MSPRQETITVRQAVPGDLDALEALLRRQMELQERLSEGHLKVRPQFDWRTYTQGKLSAGSASAALLVAEGGNRLVGYVQVRVSGGGESIRRPARRFRFSGARPAAAASPLEDARRGLIEDIFVAEGDRRRGVGSQLLQAALEWMRAAGATEVLASIWQGNRESRDFFAVHGFSTSRVIVRAPLSMNPPGARSQTTQ